MGAGWGFPGCELCPLKNTEEFDHICPKGVGLTKDGKGAYGILCDHMLIMIKDINNSPGHTLLETKGILNTKHQLKLSVTFYSILRHDGIFM